MPGRILIVDDEPEMCKMLAADLSRKGFEVAWKTQPSEARAEIEEIGPDAVIADLHLGGEDGLEFCSRTVADHPDLPVVMITAFGSMEAAIGAIRAGAFDFITKPVDLDALEIALRRAVEHGRLRRQVRVLRREVEAAHQSGTMLGASPPMRRLFDLIRKVAGSDVPVLITGESGVGKERIARTIHTSGPRAGGPFVAVNCSAIPETLLESELFGYVRGAFTDARAERLGLFREAEGGTLFMDEIGDLPHAVQPKLLRALQERRVRPLGGTGDIPFDARLIAATNRDLEEDVRAGRFREDLFYRVQVVHIEAPPLRDRGNDTLLLAQKFLEEAAARAGREVPSLAPETARLLLDYPWPGNVRELQNCIERAIALGEGGVIAPADLPDRVRAYKGPPPGAHAPGELLLSLEEIERRHVLRVLESVSGNKSQAARILGLDRKTLYRKLQGYGVVIEDE